MPPLTFQDVCAIVGKLYLEKTHEINALEARREELTQRLRQAESQQGEEPR